MYGLGDVSYREVTAYVQPILHVTGDICALQSKSCSQRQSEKNSEHCHPMRAYCASLMDAGRLEGIGSVALL